MGGCVWGIESHDGKGKEVSEEVTEVMQLDLEVRHISEPRLTMIANITLVRQRGRNKHIAHKG